MIRELGEAIGDTVVESVGRAMGRTQEQRPLPADLLESDDAYLVVFDAPGVAREDVQVRFEDGAVRVRVDRFRDFHEGYEMRFPGRGLSLEGSRRLPDGGAVDPSGASGTLRTDGTLEVRVPKQEPVAVEAHHDSDEAGGEETSESTQDGPETDGEDGAA